MIRRLVLACLFVGPLCFSETTVAQNAAAKPSFLEEECTGEFSLLGQVRGLVGRKSATVFFQHTSASRTLAVEFLADRVTLIRKDGGTTQRLASAVLPPGKQGVLEFTVKRRLWRITLICNNRVVAHGYDTSLSGGKAGWQADTGVAVTLRLQATEPVSFADDFTRTAAEEGQWEVLAGRCQIAEIAPGTHGGEVGRYSSNAFSWAATARPLAMSAAGYWFWDNYAVEVSVKPEDRGAVGVAAYLKDADNFMLFRWTAAAVGQPGSGTREIIRVENGKATLLVSRPGGFEPYQWYRLQFIAREGVFTASIDGEEACRVTDPAFGQGKMGLYARDIERVVFDDVRVVATDAFSDDFRAEEPGKWENVGIPWKTDPKSQSRVAAGSGEGITVTGRPDWDGYAFGVDVTPGKAQAVGLLFAYQNPREYSLFCVTAGKDPKAALLCVQDGQPRTVAECALPMATLAGGRLRIEVRQGQVTASLGDRPVVAAFDRKFQGGRIGFYARGPAGARFSRPVVWFPIPEPEPPRVHDQFKREQTMAAWATASGSWRPDPSGSGIFWHTGAFFGNPSIAFDVPRIPVPTEVLLLIDAASPSADTGYQALLTASPQGSCQLELRRQGKSVARASGAFRPEAPGRMYFWRAGNLVATSLGNVVAQYFDPQPLSGTRLGFRCGRPDIHVASVETTTPHVLDCTFSGPPTDWWSTRGRWDVVQRWPCDERWSFFGSIRSETPTLWTKRVFKGNLVAEAWVALLMDAPDDPRVGYTHPSDLHLTFCGNGKDLSSGYSFQFAAENNSVTRLLRREQVVAVNPYMRMVNPVRVNLAFQRHWFHLRAEKEGNRIRCFVDGQLAVEYTDPDPLPDGQVALWTSRNGLMVARARVWYQHLGPRQPLPVVDAPQAPLADPTWALSTSPTTSLTSDFEHGLNGWASDTAEEGPLLSLDRTTHSQGKQSLRVVNPISGGSFGVLCGIQRFDAVKFPVLEFDYRLDPQVRVNLYFTVQGQLMVYGLTAAALQGSSIPSLGNVADCVADGKWHTARIDLLGALRRLYPNASTITVENLAFRSPDVEYLRSGFGGNTWGSAYHLDHFRLVGGPQTTVEDARAVVPRSR